MPLSSSYEAEAIIQAQAFRPVRILLVDDDEANLLSLSATLESLGEELVLARSGEAALRELLDQDFAAILLDVKMPGMDGLETAELIRKRKRSKSTPILFLTAFRNDEHLFRGYDLGAVDFLFKPIVPEVLRSKVAVFVELARYAAQLREHAVILGQAELRFRSLLEAAPDAILITNEAGQIELVNSRTEELFNWPREILHKRNLKMLVPGWNEAAQVRSIELTGVKRDGQEFPCELTCSPLQIEGNMVINTVVRDITERRKAEEHIRRLNVDLERRVANRTMELTRSNQALQEFNWAVSHDLKEPLRTVLIFLQLFQGSTPNLGTESQEHLNRVVTAARRIELLLTGLQNYIYASDSNEGGAEMVDVADVLVPLYEQMRDQLAGCGAKLEIGPMPTVKAVRGLLDRIFQNLLTNAVKYRSEQPLRIAVTSEHLPKGWTFSVSDNGLGIPFEYHDRIFGVFKRLHNDSDVPGTGIGLAICKVAVERMGGRIWVESTPGQGSIFKFSLAAGE
jgi:PAS domain S-box-containing protein